MTPAILEYGELDSTQAEAWRIAGHTVVPAVVLASCQTAGRGRTGNRWISPVGNLYMSMIMECGEPLARAPQFSLLAGVGIGRALASAAGIEVALKWPNDVLVSGRKLGGVISERRGRLRVVGIGINVAGGIELGENSGVPACSLVDFGHGVIDVRGLAELISAELMAVESDWKSAGYVFLVDEYLRFFHDLGRSVIWESRGVFEEGEITGVDEDGALVVSANGVVKKLYSGEVRHVRRK